MRPLSAPLIALHLGVSSRSGAHPNSTTRWPVPSRGAVDTPAGTPAVREADVEDRIGRGFDYQIAGKDMTTLVETGERIRETYEAGIAERE